MRSKTGTREWSEFLWGCLHAPMLFLRIVWRPYEDEDCGIPAEYRASDRIGVVLALQVAVIACF